MTSPDPEADGQPQAAGSLSQQTSASVVWMTVQRWVTRLGGLVTLIILTRLLAPEDFGKAAAATTLIPILFVLSDVGFSTFIVQTPKLGRRTLTTAFWFSLSCGFVLAGAVAALAPAIAHLLGEPDVAPLIQVMALSVVLVAFSSVSIALMRRRMAFRALAGIEVTASFVAQIVAIIVAFAGAGAWALVLQVLASQVIYTVSVCIVARWWPRWGFSWPEFAVMAKFGLPVVGSGLVGMARSWLETVIIISGLGVREMGFIFIAQRLVLTAQELSVSALLPVATSAFSRVRGDAARLKSAYLRASAIAYAAVTPLLVFVAVSAHELIPFLFGDANALSAAVTPALVAIVLVNVSWAIDQGLYLGTGRPSRWFALVAFCSVGALAALAISVQFGLTALLATWVAVAVAETVVRWFVVRPVVKAPLAAIVSPLLGVLFPAATAAAVGWGLMRVLGGQLPLVQLALTGLGVLTVYLAVTRFVRPLTFTDTVTMLPARLGDLLRWSLPASARRGAEPHLRENDA